MIFNNVVVVRLDLPWVLIFERGRERKREKERERIEIPVIAKFLMMDDRGLFLVLLFKTVFQLFLNESHRFDIYD